MDQLSFKIFNAHNLLRLFYQYFQFTLHEASQFSQTESSDVNHIEAEEAQANDEVFSNTEIIEIAESENSINIAKAANVFTVKFENDN